MTVYYADPLTVNADFQPIRKIYQCYPDGGHCSEEPCRHHVANHMIEKCHDIAMESLVEGAMDRAIREAREREEAAGMDAYLAS